MAKTKRKTVKPAVKQEPTFFLILSIFFVFLWMAFCATGCTFPGYNWLFQHCRWGFQFSATGAAFFLLFLMGLTAWAAHKFPQKPVPDLSAFWARLGLFLALGLGVYFCSYHFGIPDGDYWDDPAANLGLVNQMKNLDDYRGTFVGLPGYFLPFWTYAAFFLSRLFPDMTMLAIQRLTNSVFELATIYAFYRLGKELGGRRLGLYCAIIVSISKPLLYKVVSGYNPMIPFFVALILWASFRLLRKDAGHSFLWWGIAVGISAYTCFPIQPFVVLFIFSGLVLIWWNDRKTLKFSKTSLWFRVSFFIFVLYGLYCTGSIPVDKWIGSERFFNFQRGISLYLIVAVAIVSVVSLLGVFDSWKRSLWDRWLFGAWLATLVSFPALTNQNIIQRIREHGYSADGNSLNLASLFAAFQHVPGTIRGLFWEYLDRPDMSLGGDPIFSYAEMVFVALGVVFCLATPSLKKSFILAIAVLGLAPHFFASMTHSGVLTVCLAPFWLLGAVGLEDLTQFVLSWNRSKFWAGAFGVLLMAFWAWSAWAVFDRVYAQWADQPQGIMCLYAKARAEMVQPENRVYLTSDIFYRSSNTLYEGLTYYQWHDQENDIDLGPGETAPNVIVYMQWEEEKSVKKQIEQFYPNAQWSTVESPLEPGAVKAYRCEIPAADIAKGKGKIFNVRPIQGDFWKRTWAYMPYHLGHFTGIAEQDEVANVKAPYKLTSYEGLNETLEGKIRVKKSGEYTLTCIAMERTMILIDGHERFDMTFVKTGADYVALPKSRKVTIELEQGEHAIKVLAFRPPVLPRISLKPLDGSADEKSIWETYDF